MAFGTASEMFTNTFLDILQQTALLDFNTHTFKVALYGNTGTPAQDAASANTAYGVGAWVVGNEIYDGAEWPVTGQALDSATTSIYSTYNIKFDATDEVSAGTSATLTSVYGCLVYDDTIASPVADQGVSYHYFGSPTGQSVTDGTFTVVWNAAGIWTLTL